MGAHDLLADEGGGRSLVFISAKNDCESFLTYLGSLRALFIWSQSNKLGLSQQCGVKQPLLPTTQNVCNNWEYVNTAPIMYQ